MKRTRLALKNSKFLAVTGALALLGSAGAVNAQVMATAYDSGGTEIPVDTTSVSGYRIHTFTTSGTLDVTTGGTIEVLLVGGGGGGGGYVGGGGGGGAVVHLTSATVSDATSYAVVVGGGGAGGGVLAGSSGSNGNPSSMVTANGTAEARGGGGGGSYTSTTPSTAGDGGSGGGSGSLNTTLAAVNGAADGLSSLGGNTGYIYGHDGGSVTNARIGTGDSSSRGGGGAGAAAPDGPAAGPGGPGGDGVVINMLGANHYWGGGGGGGGFIAPDGGDGGLGGGGAGGSHSGSPGAGGTGGLNDGADGTGSGGAGGANTGGGGGGSGGKVGDRSGGNGGSGIVIVRYVLSADGDDIPDAWEEQYGGTNLFWNGGDWDEDGLQDQDEFIAGTNPTNAASTFAIDNLFEADGHTLAFQGVGGRTYHVQWSTNLMSTNWWILEGTSVTATTDGDVQISDTNAAPQKFYRLFLDPQAQSSEPTPEPTPETTYTTFQVYPGSRTVTCTLSEPGELAAPGAVLLQPRVGSSDYNDVVYGGGNFGQASALFQAAGYRVVSFPLPYDGSIANWYTQFMADNDPFPIVVEDAQAIIDEIIAQGWASSGRIYVTGASRVGYCALRIMEADSRVGAAEVDAPVTDWRALTEWAGGAHLPAVAALALTNYATNLTGRPIWAGIGNMDTRVSTACSLAFCTAIAEEQERVALSASTFQAHVIPAAGHAFPLDWRAEGAAWLLARAN